MGKGRMGQGNGFRAVGNAREARRRQQACRLRARTFSLLQLPCFIVFVAETRETVGGRACSGLCLHE